MAGKFKLYEEKCPLNLTSLIHLVEPDTDLKFSTKFCFCCLSYLKELGFDNKNITSIQDIEIAKSKNLAEVRFDPFRTHN